MLFVALDLEDDEWPECLNDSTIRMATAALATLNSNSGEGGGGDTPKRRGVTRRRSESLLYNAAAMLAGVAAGFDVRIANTTGIHPNLQTLVAATPPQGTPYQPRHRHRNPMRDSRLFAHNENDGSSFPEYPLASATGAPHNTYHGYQTRYRPTVNFDVPTRFSESSYDGFQAYSDSRTTPSSDNRTTPSADSRRTTPSAESRRTTPSAESRRTTPSAESRRTTPSVSGMSYSIGSQSPHKSSVDEGNENDMALISLSPSTDKAFVEYQRQQSDTSSVFETPWTTPKSTPQRHGVKFETDVKFDDMSTHKSPSVYLNRCSPSITSGSSIGLGAHDSTARLSCENHPDNLRCHSGIPSPICPPPARRASSQERHNQQQGSIAERPVTLDIIARPRPHAGILKRASPVHLASHDSPQRTSRVTPLDTSSARSDDSGFCHVMRSTTPSVGTPRRASQCRTLLDIDVEGQQSDSTKPLPARPL